MDTMAATGGTQGAADNETGNPRVHSETAAEGNDGGDMPEIRMHSQAAAEGPDD